MLEELKKHLSQFKDLNPKDIALLISKVRIKTYKKGEILAKSGELHNDFITVLKGMIINYVERADGENRTMKFTFEGMTTASRSSFFVVSPASETIEAIEDCWVGIIERSEFEKLAKERPNILWMYSQQFKKAANDAAEHIWFHTVLNPEERYIHLRDNYPQIISRAQIKLIASFLGITPVSLYRIRARLAASGK